MFVVDRNEAVEELVVTLVIVYVSASHFDDSCLMGHFLYIVMIV
jgi:hypothetical protein